MLCDLFSFIFSFFINKYIQTFLFVNKKKKRKIVNFEKYYIFNCSTNWLDQFNDGPLDYNWIDHRD